MAREPRKLRRYDERLSRPGWKWPQMAPPDLANANPEAS